MKSKIFACLFFVMILGHVSLADDDPNEFQYAQNVFKIGYLLPADQIKSNLTGRFDCAIYHYRGSVSYFTTEMKAFQPVDEGYDVKGEVIGNNLSNFIISTIAHTPRYKIFKDENVLARKTPLHRNDDSHVYIRFFEDGLVAESSSGKAELDGEVPLSLVDQTRVAAFYMICEQKDHNFSLPDHFWN